ncbi:flagellar hook-associated protein FlgK [Candidatus Nucleicultrix amoebiphila]|jgi:flagellar hook-associated protein 1 FlgK|uniref:Flagellar hook-associated protein 1 n=1 Tax=Candidatus Nucleicultrix amoebiphila FS5 TaxID=1414854 RepID=A0A1W6N3Q8_9PROT|nr:flagellar hook-associated protein FlgK [Candidatus Nucleicultrix amoebiphila]ARN84527.1 hypothetical protein GQ61_03410 [Candidatus Nucleicultrix amoebiphila FS5]
MVDVITGSGITSALRRGLEGIIASGARNSITAKNIANANTEGYTRKISTLVTTEGGGVIAGAPQRMVDEVRVANLQSQTSDVEYLNVKSSYLKNIEQQIGQPGTGGSLGEYMSQLSQSMSTLATSPNSPSKAIDTINNATLVAGKINQFANFIQANRSQADQQIAFSINEANAAISEIHQLNHRIVQDKVNKLDCTDLEDKRQVAINALAEKLNIISAEQDNGAIFIYTENMRTIVDSAATARTFTYVPTGAITASTVYPGGIPPIQFNGADVTMEITSGELAGLISLRDVDLPNLQANLDTLTVNLRDQMNALHNRGTGITGQRVMQGNRAIPTPLTTNFQGTGQLRIAVIDNTNGSFVEQQVIDLTAMGVVTMDNFRTALVAGLNNVDATWQPDGAGNSLLNLAINNNSPNNGNYGIALVSIPRVNEADAIENTTGQHISDFFDLNAFFKTGTRVTNDGNPSITGLSQLLQVRSDLLTNNGLLARGKLNQSIAIPLPTEAIKAGDGEIISAMSLKLNQSIPINASPNIPARTQSLIDFAGSIIATNSQIAKNTYDDLEMQNGIKQQMMGEIGAQSGVNFSEEITDMLQNQFLYSMSTQIVKTAREMMSALLDIK